MSVISKRWFSFGLAGSVLLASCASPPVEASQSEQAGQSVAVNAEAEGYATAIFAMGCFWCAESDFEKVDGVIDVVSGYTGGSVENPTYEQVTYAETGHYEAVLVTYDPAKVSYEELLTKFWMNIDPFDPRGQFCDKGTSYRAAAFPQTPEEVEAAEASKERWAQALDKEPVTQIIERTPFYTAEEYHQDYYKKNPIRYRIYRSNCGRDARLEQVWGSVSK